MVTSFDELVHFKDRSRPAVDVTRSVRRTPVVDSRRTRRRFLRDVATTATAAGLVSIASIPSAKRAWGSHAEPDMAPTFGPAQCGALGSWVDDDGCQGCHRTTCGNCCASTNFHKHPASTGFTLRDDDCDGPNDSGNWDGWKWQVDACCPNGRAGQVWRCHDGFLVQSGQDEKTVCKYRTHDGDTCNP